MVVGRLRKAKQTTLKNVTVLYPSPSDALISREDVENRFIETSAIKLANYNYNNLSYRISVKVEKMWHKTGT